MSRHPTLTDVSAVTRQKYPFHSKHPSSLYTDAFQQWKSVRARLGTMIQEYLDACTTLKDVCAQPPPSPSEERWLDPVLIAINSELPSIVSDESKMFEARKQLGIARNYSPSLVPINRLPPEALVQIFGYVLAYNGCYTWDPPQTKPIGSGNELPLRLLTDVISGVSTHWRQLAINTPAFWTHLDLNICGYGSGDPRIVETDCFISCAELWISRARGHPLSIHIFDDGNADGPYDEVLQFLTKHLSQIAILRLDIQVPYLSRLILSRLLCYGSLSSLKTLVCNFSWTVRADNVELFDEPLANDEVPSTSMIDCILSPLHTLHLMNCLAQWSSPAYSGLVDLRIWGGCFPEDKTPTITQLETMLRASPRLRTLKLGAIKIRSSVAINSATQTAVTLNDLEVLDLAWMGSSSLGLLLPIIIPGERPLTMSAKVFHDKTGAVSALRRFFGMAKIVRLQMIGRTGWHSVFSHLYSHLPDLEVLVLKHQNVFRDNSNENSFDLLKESASSPSPHYPRLGILYLIGGSADLTWLQQLLANHSVRELQLHGVRLASHEVTEASLKQLVPCVKVTDGCHTYDYKASMCCFAW